MHKYLKWATHAFSGLRLRLLLVVVVACAPLMILTLRTAWEDRRRARENWQQQSEKVLELARREEQRIISETRQFLIPLADAGSVRNGSRRGSKDLIEKFASDARYANLGVTTTNLELLASSAGRPSGTDQAQHDFFRRVVETASFVIDPFALNTPGAEPIVTFGYPVFDRFGQAQAAVFAEVNLSSLERFNAELAGQLPHGAVWMQFDRKGNLLARYPSTRNWDEPLPERALLRTAFSRSDGVIDAPGAGALATFYAFARTRDQLIGGETVTLLGIPNHVLFASADAALRRNLAWLGFAVGFALLLGWFLSDLLFLRPVRALVRSSTRLASGDLSARTGLPHGRDELGRLTLAFDLMAQALEQRELDRRGASHKLQILSHRLVEVQETERRQIARELHDEIGQSLTVAEMNLQAALKSTGQAKMAHRLQESIQAVERVLEQVHDLSLNLRPSMLDDLGLEPALRWYLNRQAASAGLEARFRADTLERRMDPVIETECFRVAQEALTNVVRHSQARRVAVELQRENGHLHLRVRDDGVGFDVAAQRRQAVAGSSLGLLSMEERASLSGGGLEFNSTPGKGTEVHAWFPLKWRESDKEESLALTDEKSD